MHTDIPCNLQTQGLSPSRDRPRNVYFFAAIPRYPDCLEDMLRQLALLLLSRHVTLRYDADAPISLATFNRLTYAVVDQASKHGVPLEHFTVHDLRWTGSTLLHELGFNRDWIEKCLAHEDGRSSRGVHNKAE